MPPQVSPELIFRHDGSAHQFQVELDGTVIGFLDYVVHDRAAHLVHTEVNAAFRGRQIAVQLTRFGIKELRDMGFEIVAVCPFVISYMKRYPEE
jgi:hypothetical protein